MGNINDGSKRKFLHSIDIGWQYTEAWNSKDPKQVLELFLPDGTFTGPRDPQPVGLDKIEAKVKDFITGFPDFMFTNIALHTISDCVSSLQWMFAGTHTGYFSGLAPTGNEVWLPGISVFTLQDRKLISVQDSFNAIAFLDQIQKGTYNLKQFRDLLGLVSPQGK